MKKNLLKYYGIICFILSFSMLMVSCGKPSTLENNNQNNFPISDNIVTKDSDDVEIISLTPTPSIKPTATIMLTPTLIPSPIPKLPDTASWTDETHQYVWFGSYPQTEIKGDELTETIINAAYDSNGVAIIGSSKYKRLCEEDQTRLYYQNYDEHNLFQNNHSDYFDWTVNEYAYFIYEPIKWRVLSSDNNKLFLLTEAAIDIQPYNASQEDISWNSCTLRSWLNGYGESENELALDYSMQGANFITTAFTENERTYILETENENSALYRPNEPISVEKIFLLSSEDVLNTQYGFNESRSVWYEASGRVAYNTEYAMIMGGGLFERDGLFQSIWWLRSLSNPNEEDGISAVIISLYGNFSADMVSVPFLSVRPAIYLQLK